MPKAKTPTTTPRPTAAPLPLRVVHTTAPTDAIEQPTLAQLCRELAYAMGRGTQFDALVVAEGCELARLPEPLIPRPRRPTLRLVKGGAQ